MAHLMAENYKADMRRHRTQCLRKRIDDLLSNRQLLAIALEKKNTYGEFIDYSFIWSDVKYLFMGNPDGDFKYLDRLVTKLNKIIDDDILDRTRKREEQTAV